MHSSLCCCSRREFAECVWLSFCVYFTLVFVWRKAQKHQRFHIIPTRKERKNFCPKCSNSYDNMSTATTASPRLCRASSSTLICTKLKRLLLLQSSLNYVHTKWWWKAARLCDCVTSFQKATHNPPVEADRKAYNELYSQLAVGTLGALARPNANMVLCQQVYAHFYKYILEVLTAIKHKCIDTKTICRCAEETGNVYTLAETCALISGCLF